MLLREVNLSDLLAFHAVSFRTCSEDGGVALNLHQPGKVSGAEMFFIGFSVDPMATCGFLWHHRQPDRLV